MLLEAQQLVLWDRAVYCTLKPPWRQLRYTYLACGHGPGGAPDSAWFHGFLPAQFLQACAVTWVGSDCELLREGRRYVRPQWNLPLFVGPWAGTPDPVPWTRGMPLQPSVITAGPASPRTPAATAGSRGARPKVGRDPKRVVVQSGSRKKVRQCANLLPTPVSGRDGHGAHLRLEPRAWRPRYLSTGLIDLLTASGAWCMMHGVSSTIGIPALRSHAAFL